MKHCKGGACKKAFDQKSTKGACCGTKKEHDKSATKPAHKHGGCRGGKGHSCKHG